mmetsp:Transcript_31533/g.43278  ORF Transcript_31533/g.43278 Transcript_31533/m.43278 type:complete len:336 (-) Transcript_31533:214-1221(-)
MIAATIVFILSSNYILPSVIGTWYCVDIQSIKLSTGVTWKTENCTNDETQPPLLTVNSVSIDLRDPTVKVIPAVSGDEASPLQTIPDMAAQNSKFIAGINGGYFWRVDISGVWIDDVCRGKTRNEANKAASADNVNYGVSDGVVKIDGVVKGNNCNCSGYSRPAVLELDGTLSTIEVMNRGDAAPQTVSNAIGAGPNLVSYDSASQSSFIDIPSDDDNINILEHAANTAVGLVLSDTEPHLATTLLMVTTDGSDECGPKDITCGLNSRDLASLLKDHFKADRAMSMDQGGSTTMWVKGANPDRNGVVSRSHNTEPAEQDGPRNVANGLFVELLTA